MRFLLSKKQNERLAYRSSTQSISHSLRAKGILSPTSEDMREGILMLRKNIGMLPGMYRSAGSLDINFWITLPNDFGIKGLSSDASDKSLFLILRSVWHLLVIVIILLVFIHILSHSHTPSIGGGR